MERIQTKTHSRRCEYSALRSHPGYKVYSKKSIQSLARGSSSYLERSSFIHLACAELKPSFANLPLVPVQQK